MGRRVRALASPSPLSVAIKQKVPKPIDIRHAGFIRDGLYIFTLQASRYLSLHVFPSLSRRHKHRSHRAFAAKSAMA